MTVTTLAPDQCVSLIGDFTYVRPGQIPYNTDKVQLLEKEYIGRAKSSRDAAMQLAAQNLRDDRRDDDRVYLRSITMIGVDFEHVCIITAALRPAPFDFSAALTKLKNGESLLRAGWNGKNQFVYIEDFAHFTGPTYLRSCMVLHNAQGELQPGWLPSMGDLMAEDWEIK